MKLSAFVAIAAVIGGSYLVPVPAKASIKIDIDSGHVHKYNDGKPDIAIKYRGHVKAGIATSSTYGIKWPATGPFGGLTKKVGDYSKKKFVNEGSYDHYKKIFVEGFYSIYDATLKTRGYW